MARGSSWDSEVSMQATARGIAITLGLMSTTIEEMTVAMCESDAVQNPIVAEQKKICVQNDLMPEYNHLAQRSVRSTPRGVRDQLRMMQNWYAKPKGWEARSCVFREPRRQSLSLA